MYQIVREQLMTMSKFDVTTPPSYLPICVSHSVGKPTRSILVVPSYLFKIYFATGRSNVKNVGVSTRFTYTG